MDRVRIGEDAKAIRTRSNSKFEWLVAELNARLPQNRLNFFSDPSTFSNSFSDSLNGRRPLKVTRCTAGPNVLMKKIGRCSITKMLTFLHTQKQSGLCSVNTVRSAVRSAVRLSIHHELSKLNLVSSTYRSTHMAHFPRKLAYSRETPFTSRSDFLRDAFILIPDCYYPVLRPDAQRTA